MKNLKVFGLGLIYLAITSCNPTNKMGKTITSITRDKDWTLESSPNGLDVVGVVFAIDAKGVQTRIPGGTLELKTLTAPVEVTKQTITKNLSAGAVINFLALKNIGEDANATLADTATMNATFKVNNGTMTVIDDDIRKAFDAKSSVIASNIKTFGLEDAPLYIILETIKSPEVQISIDKNKVMQAGFFANYKKIVDANPNIKLNNSNNANLTYKLNEPLTVFYKLRSIDVNVIGAKGTPEEKIDLSIGDVVKSDELVFKRKE